MRQSGVNYFLWYMTYCFGMNTQIRYERTLLVWQIVYSVKHTVWCEQSDYGVNEILMVWTTIYNVITPDGGKRHSLLVWSSSQWCDHKFVLKINYVHTSGGVIAPSFGVMETSVWCDHFTCFFLMSLRPSLTDFAPVIVCTLGVIVTSIKQQNKNRASGGYKMSETLSVRHDFYRFVLKN
jgi:hypothetical protein